MIITAHALNKQILDLQGIPGWPFFDTMWLGQTTSLSSKFTPVEDQYAIWCGPNNYFVSVSIGVPFRLRLGQSDEPINFDVIPIPCNIWYLPAW